MRAFHSSVCQKAPLRSFISGDTARVGAERCETGPVKAAAAIASWYSIDVWRECDEVRDCGKSAIDLRRDAPPGHRPGLEARLRASGDAHTLNTPPADALLRSREATCSVEPRECKWGTF